MAQRQNFNKQIRTEAMRAGRAHAKGTYVESRKCWTSDLPISAVLYVKELAEGSDAVQLYLHVMRTTRPFKMYLTSLRPDELLVLKAVIDEAFERAMAASTKRHQEHLDAYSRGETPHLSLYREQPRVHRAEEIPEGIHVAVEGQDVPKPEAGGTQGASGAD